MNDPYETTETHLARLLGRALNSFDLPDATVERLYSALAHASSLHSSHHSADLDRATYRHAYLLADGSSVVLWELVHNSGPGSSEQHEVYADESEVRLAASRLPSGFPGFADPGPAGRPDAGFGAVRGSGRGGGHGSPGAGAVGAGAAGAEASGGEYGVPDAADRGALGPAGLGSDPLQGGDFGPVPGPGFDSDIDLLAGLLAAPPAPLPRMYVPDNSADHARRVLRRAENADGPGPETAELLRSAFAHHITQVFGRQCRVGDREAGFTLYEHAFLLIDGAEVSLWEVEHTATPDGRHMCEVYVSESDARGAMESRGRGRSVPRAGL
ncbi:MULTISPECIES: DUF6227 family protein [Streptomyces]|uniref:Uncharacterized protein n=1 Tax=Streptomyces tsukubensis (strain DSM 42081 / NBRC 108919 / NRRL 18488 / 9993) TaxID=1114943 RepID=I2N007_STRT9|nr:MULTISPECIES: DUF6227 family protein [Streptomyces]AZK94566.1 hypothetical protein B7R87_12365 [Streptomyces tsukubensis]EIF90354.1 hypothetical protein [Streptomyces tsukubensis NRRL18488]MYS67521.1 hypothetical protein [Streptomyces sp. SID5473]QKM69347.1 hypothetical protein STSU_021405 [Streptomyces tsukubensis NRRL18488]TAI42721.1 hypothetical protein EWI31_20130 [Streptomyces tsukubensis]